MFGVDGGGDFETPGQVEIELAEPFVGEAMKVQWQSEPSAARYLLEVWSKDQYRRGFYLDRDITAYEYHWQDAQKDVAGRTITVQVRAVNAENVEGEWGRVTATNPPPDAPTNVSAVGLLNSIRIRCDHNYDEDILELRVYGDQRSDFIPAPDNLLAAEHASLLSFPVEVDSYWFMRLAWVDVWGSDDLNFSGVVEAEVGPITETEIGPDSISTPMLKANSVIAEKIEADAITGREISSETTITAGSGNKTAGMNGMDKDGEPVNGIRFWSGAAADNAEQANFRVYGDGSTVLNDLEANDAVLTNMTASGSITGGTIKGTDIYGVNISADSEITGGLVRGATVISGTIIGADIFTGDPLLLADPYGNGLIVYYDSYPDQIPLACESSYNFDRNFSVSSGSNNREVVDFVVLSAGDRLGDPNTQRHRYPYIVGNPNTPIGIGTAYPTNGVKIAFFAQGQPAMVRLQNVVVTFELVRNNATVSQTVVENIGTPSGSGSRSVDFANGSWLIRYQSNTSGNQQHAGISIAPNGRQPFGNASGSLSGFVSITMDYGLSTAGYIQSAGYLRISGNNEVAP